MGMASRRGFQDGHNKRWRDFNMCCAGQWRDLLITSTSAAGLSTVTLSDSITAANYIPLWVRCYPRSLPH